MKIFCMFLFVFTFLVFAIKSNVVVSSKIDLDNTEAPNSNVKSALDFIETKKSPNVLIYSASGGNYNQPIQIDESYDSTYDTVGNDPVNIKININGRELTLSDINNCKNCMGDIIVMSKNQENNNDMSNTVIKIIINDSLKNVKVDDIPVINGFRGSQSSFDNEFQGNHVLDGNVNDGYYTYNEPQIPIYRPNPIYDDYRRSISQTGSQITWYYSPYIAREHKKYSNGRRPQSQFVDDKIEQPLSKTIA